jgi:long-chain fatty acid transport protein
MVWSIDLRYFDYRNTDGFGDTGYNPWGKLEGLGWSNQFALATGLQYRLLENLLTRVGYTYNTNQIGENDAFYNVASPLNYQHQLSVGASWELSECVAAHASYTHYFEFDATGPIILPAGPIPGSSVTNTASGDIASLGVTVRY